MCGAAAVGMSAGASGGEAVAIAKGEDKAALLQRLRQQVCWVYTRHSPLSLTVPQRLEREAHERQREKQVAALARHERAAASDALLWQVLGLVAPAPVPTFDSEDPLTGFSSTFR